MDETWPDEAAAGAVIRSTARVLLVDDHERVLLFRYVAGDGEHFWCPVGGALEAGESSEDAARREVVEETGFPALRQLALVGRRRHVVPFLGQLTDIREEWFLARVAGGPIETSGWTPLERRTISDHRWWNVGDLALADERLVPGDLAGLMERLTRDGPPATPLVLGR
jgi:8-oxo-dGTP pyrophosphatase MutT (NUDIX family)